MPGSETCAAVTFAITGTRGAFGLIRSQDAENMSSPQPVEDWVSWGEHDFSRESYAVAGKKDITAFGGWRRFVNSDLNPK